MKQLLLVAGLLAFHSLSAQHEFDNWYFGVNVGVSFVSGSPVNLSGGQLGTIEGSASISDSAGNLLFYTNGIDVWDKNNTIMPNGTGLLGALSSSQSALIVSDPGNANQYYIFTTDAFQAANGFQYSIVDMTLNGGNGDIGPVKNIQLLNICDEKVTAIRNSSNNGFWVVTHGPSNSSNSYYAYPLTASGIGAPVVSNVGPIYLSFQSYIGYMKISPTGDYIARAMYGSHEAEIAQFDNTTGMVSNPATFHAGAQDGLYGVEFSASGNVLYMSCGEISPSKLFQFDMTAGSTTAIKATGTVLDVDSTHTTGAIQIASDNKIYVLHSGSMSLGVINYPDVFGPGCNYIRNGFVLTDVTALGLPNAVCGLTPIPPTAMFTSPNQLCPGSCTDFTNQSQYGTSYLWNFPGATPAGSTLPNPTGICYNTPGSYSVSLIVTNSIGSDTLTLNNYMNVYPFPPPQAVLQSGDTLFANQGADFYQWFFNGNMIPSATNYYYVASQSGNYNVVAKDENGCEAEAVINNVIAGITHSVNGIGGLAIYPVPVIDDLNIHCNTFTGSSIEVSVFNMLGECVIEPSSIVIDSEKTGHTDVSTLAAGMYSVRIQANDSVIYGTFTKK